MLVIVFIMLETFLNINERYKNRKIEILYITREKRYTYFKIFHFCGIKRYFGQDIRYMVYFCFIADSFKL